MRRRKGYVASIKTPGKWKSRGGLSSTSKWIDADRILARFASRVHVDSTTGCWLWTGGLGSHGYGCFSIGFAGIVKAHQASYYIFKGALPRGQYVLDHTCDVRSCVNPRHLRKITWAANKARGNSGPAINARKTHCVYGHAFTKENTYRWPGKRRGRNCKTCRSIAMRRFYAKKKLKGKN